MITESSSFLKILTCQSNRIILQSPHISKFIYKQHQNIPESNQTKLQKLHELSHPKVLTIFRIMNNQHSEGSRITGLCYQHFQSLNQLISGDFQEFQQQQIISTFEPIIQAIQYLEQKNVEIGSVGANNIVITQSQQIKFVHQCLLSPVDFCLKNSTRSKIYSELCQLIYDFLIRGRKQKPIKSWKGKLQKVQKLFSRQTYDFFLSVFRKSNNIQTEKCKKICKKRKIMEGKQNKLIQ